MSSPSFKPQIAPKERVIVALDVDSEISAIELVRTLSDHGVSFKVGLELYATCGPALVSKLVEKGNRIFLDLKFHDIPNTVARAASEAVKLGVWMMNVHALGGREMMTRAAESVADAASRSGLTKPHLLGVTILTSSTRETIAEVGIHSDLKDAVLALGSLAAGCGLDGVVASANEAELLRASEDTSDLIIVTPGIRPAFATNNDQKRVKTPAEAIRSGASYLVIGRPVTRDADPAKALGLIIDEIERAENGAGTPID